MPERRPHDPFDDLRDEIRARKLRATPARVAVLDELRRSTVPLSHDEVRERVGTTYDRATIYRALNQLAGAELLRRTDLGDHVWRFSIAGATTPRHATFVCESCGAVLPLVDATVVTSRGAPRAIGRGLIEIRVTGRCDDCL